MLEGLEATEIRHSQLERTKRFDAEYFKKHFLYLADVLASRKTQQLTQLASISDGNHFSIAENFTDEGIPYYRGQDVTGKPFVELSTPKYIDERSFNEPHMIRSHLKQGDVLLSIVGTIGESSLVTSTQPATCSCKLAILRPKNIDPNYLAVVLQSDYGKSQIARLTRGAIQMGLLLEDMDQVLIPSFSKDFESGISQIVKLSQIAIETSKTTQKQAEQTLLRILDLENWQPQQALSYERKASDVFAAERLDAEYYYPEKTAALKFLESLPGKTVGKMFVSIRDLWQPDTASKNQQVQNYDLTDALSPFLDTEKEPVYPEEISSTKKKLSQGQIIVSRLRSYLKEIALVLHDTNIPMVASTEFIVLQPTGQMNIETLMVYLRSILPQTIFKWSQDGSNHPRFDEKELLNLRVPDILLEHQGEIAKIVQESISCRQQAKSLLEAAKRAVEIAIEESEEAAMAYLQPFLSSESDYNGLSDTSQRDDQTNQTED